MRQSLFINLSKTIAEAKAFLISLTGILIMFCQLIIQTLLTGFYQYTPKKLEIKETTYTISISSFLGINLKLYSPGQLSTILYDKRHELKFVIIIFPQLDSNTIKPADEPEVTSIKQSHYSCPVIEKFI